MNARPTFLQRHHENGETIVTDFRALPMAEAEAVDRWLLVATVYGSLTWQERRLFEWIEESEDCDCGN